MKRLVVLGLALEVFAVSCRTAPPLAQHTGTPSPMASASSFAPSPPSPRPSMTGTAPPHFVGSISAIDPMERAAMISSGVWRQGCPVSIERLRLLTVTFWGFSRSVQTGRLVVNEDVAADVLGVMHRLFDQRFLIRRMELVDAYGGDDDRSMAADNSSAFNCRTVAGAPGVWSQHAYGRAIDLNPVENPYVSGSTVLPPSGARYADRTLTTPGMVHANDATVRVFTAAGWG